MKKLLTIITLSVCSTVLAMDQYQNNLPGTNSTTDKQKEMQRLLEKYNSPAYSGPGMPQESREALEERYKKINTIKSQYSRIKKGK